MDSFLIVKLIELQHKEMEHKAKYLRVRTQPEITGSSRVRKNLTEFGSLLIRVGETMKKRFGRFRKVPAETGQRMCSQGPCW